MGASASGSKTTQNSSTSVDQNTQHQMGQIWNAGVASGQAGPSPLLTGAAGYNSGMMGAGQTGMAALSGDPHAVQGLMNPYQQQVIDANNAGWQKANTQALNQTDARATAAGAFGGSRNGVAAGTALAANNAAQAQQTAGLLSNGYDTAMNQAGQLAQMGYAGAGANSQLGFAGVGSPQAWQLAQMKAGFLGPTGQQSSGATTNVAGGFHFGAG